MKEIKLIVCFVFLLLNAVSFSQAILNVPLRSFFSHEAIAKNNIRSVVVFADLFEEEEGEELLRGMSGKVAEIEFDSRGHKQYKRTVNDLQDLPFLTFGSSDRIDEYYYDDKGIRRYMYRENEEGTYRFVEGPDLEGRLVQVVVLNNDQVESNHHLKWKDGKMIKFEDRGNDIESNAEYAYDEKGRVRRITHDGYGVSFDYQQIGDTVFFNEYSVSPVDSFLTDSATYHVDFEHHYTRYIRYIEKEVLQVDMKVAYDKYGNAKRYDLINLGDRTSTQVKKKEEHYRIDNVYDDRDLLKTRRFYSVESGSETLVRVERFVYDTNGLDFKIEKCEIYENSDFGIND